MGLINDYQEKNDPQFRNTLQLPQVKAPTLQDTSNNVPTQVVNEQPIELSNQPQAAPEPVYQPLQEMAVPPGQNVDAIINARLATQYPTLTNGASLVDSKQQNDFNEWLNNTLQDRQTKAQVNSLGALPAPGSTKDGFTQNSLRAPFGTTDYTDDGILGNELDFSKGRFGQMGEGVLGGIFYGLNSVFGTVGASVMDTTALGATSGVSLWDAAGAAFQGKNPIDAFNKRFDNTINRIYKGGQTYVGQVWQGRDLGAMGAYMTGDSDDDYTRLYGASPVAAVLDSGFGIDKATSNDLKEFSSLSIQRNTYGSNGGDTAALVRNVPVIGGVLEAGVGVVNMLNSAIPKFDGKLPEEQEKRYLELRDKQDAGVMTRFLARQAIGFVFDTFLDLNPFDVFNAPKGTTPPTVEEPGKLARQDRSFTMPDGVSPVEPRRQYRTSPQNLLPPEPLRVTDTRIIGDLPELPPTKNTLTTIDVPYSILETEPLLLEIPRTVELESSVAPLSLSGNAKVDKLLAGALDEPRSAVPVMRLPDVWENISEGQPLVTPTTPDVVSIREKMQPLLPEAKPVVEQVATPKIESEAPTIKEETWNPVSEKGRVRVEVNADDTQIRRTFTSGSAQVNEMSAVNKLRDTDLIPKVLGETPDSVTYEKLQGVPLDGVQPFDEMVQLLGSRVRQLHDKGVVHGDLHLGNVFYDAEKNTLQFIDFENAATNEALGSRAIREVQDEVGFVRDEIEAAGGNVAAFDAGYGVAPKEPEAPQIPKPQSTVARAVNSGAAKKVDAGRIQVTKPEAPQAKQLEHQAVDLTSIYGQYDARELPLLLSRAAAQPGEMTFNGKVGEINFAVRSTDQILRVASLIPHPDGTGRPLLPPSVKQVAAFESKFGVPHPYKEYARSRVPTKGNIASVTDTMGQADRHKSIAHHAVENGLSYGAFYQKLLDPSGTAYPDQFIEALERGAAKGEGIVLKTGKDQYAVMSTPPKKDLQQLEQDTLRQLGEESTAFFNNGRELFKVELAKQQKVKTPPKPTTPNEAITKFAQDALKNNTPQKAQELTNTFIQELATKQFNEKLQEVRTTIREQAVDSIIQEEKIKTTLLNVEASRQELEVLQESIRSSDFDPDVEVAFDKIDSGKEPTYYDLLKKIGSKRIELDSDITLILELGEDSVNIGFTFGGKFSRQEGNTIKPSTLKKAKAMWKRMLESPKGKIKWTTEASDSDLDAALRKQAWYVKSFGFELPKGADTDDLHKLTLDNRPNKGVTDNDADSLFDGGEGTASSNRRLIRIDTSNGDTLEVATLKATMQSEIEALTSRGGTKKEINKLRKEYESVIKLLEKRKKVVSEKVAEAPSFEVNGLKVFVDKEELQKGYIRKGKVKDWGAITEETLKSLVSTALEKYASVGLKPSKDLQIRFASVEDGLQGGAEGLHNHLSSTITVPLSDNMGKDRLLYVLVHELGHHFDRFQPKDFVRKDPTELYKKIDEIISQYPAPTEYAKTNREERIAEAFANRLQSGKVTEQDYPGDYQITELVKSEYQEIVKELESLGVSHDIIDAVKGMMDGTISPKTPGIFEEGTTSTEHILKMRDAAIKGENGWKTTIIKEVPVYYKNDKQLTLLRSELARNPIPQHLWKSNTGGVILQNAGGLNGAHGVAFSNGKNAHVISMGSSGARSSTVLHETIHSVVSDVVQSSSAKPDSNSLWSRIAKVEPAFDSYGATKPAEDITTSMEWYTKDPEALRVVSPLRYEAANKIYESRQQTEAFLKDSNNSIEYVENVAQYAAEIADFDIENPFSYLRLAGLDALPLKEKLEVLQAATFYKDLPDKFRAKSNNIELDSTFLSKDSLSDFLISSGVRPPETPTQLRRIVEDLDGNAYTTQERLYATAYFMHNNPEGLKRVTAADKAQRIKSTLSQLNAIDFSAKVALNKLQEENVVNAANLLDEYKKIQDSTKKEQIAKLQMSQKDVGVSAKIENEKYSSESLC